MFCHFFLIARVGFIFKTVLSHMFPRSFPQMETRVGLYVEYLQDWFSVFPREQFIIQTLEDYHRNGSRVLNAIFTHLGLGMCMYFNAQDKY